MFDDELKEIFKVWDFCMKMIIDLKKKKKSEHLVKLQFLLISSVSGKAFHNDRNSPEYKKQVLN